MNFIKNSVTKSIQRNIMVEILKNNYESIKKTGGSSE